MTGQFHWKVYAHDSDEVVLPEIDIQLIKTILFQETNMRSRAKNFNETDSFVLTNLKFFLKLFV